MFHENGSAGHAVHREVTVLGGNARATLLNAKERKMKTRSAPYLQEYNYIYTDINNAAAALERDLGRARVRT
jgi:hypothetical protein